MGSGSRGESGLVAHYVVLVGSADLDLSWQARLVESGNIRVQARQSRHIWARLVVVSHGSHGSQGESVPNMFDLERRGYSVGARQGVAVQFMQGQGKSRLVGEALELLLLALAKSSTASR